MAFLLRMGWFLRLRWKQYLSAVLLIVFDYGLGLLPPIIVGVLIDAMELGSLTFETLLRNTWLLAGIGLVAYIANVLWVNLLFRNAILVEHTIRSNLLQHLTRLTPSFFQRNSRGDLMAQATNDIKAVNMAAGFGIMTLVHTVVGCVLVMTMMIVVADVKLMLAAMLPLPLLGLAIRQMGRAMRTRFLAAQEAFGKLNDRALESISGVRVIRSYVQEQFDVEAFYQVAEETRRKNLRVSVVHALFHPVISILVGIAFCIGIGYGSYKVYQGDITLGNLVAFNMYLGMLIWPMMAFGEFINVMQRGSASADRIHGTLQQQPDVKEGEAPITEAEPGPIVFDKLSFRYPHADRDALIDISLAIERGQTLGIVGKTGSGKSTLLKQLLRQYPIQPNGLYVDGFPIERIAIDRIKSWIGYVPQEHLLLSKSIRDNVRLGKIDASDEAVQRAVELAFLHHDIEQMRDGLDTLIGENGLALSGGQKQRLGIARALLIDPEILILDDALSAVDARTESAILQNLRAERRGKTTLIATHRLSAVQHADWIIVLDGGRITEAGTHEQLMRKGGWYKTQYERQQIEASLLQ